jgi:uncharacterized Tic20 family protein
MVSTASRDPHHAKDALHREQAQSTSRDPRPASRDPRPASDDPRPATHDPTGYRAPALEPDPGLTYGPSGEDDDRLWAMVAYLGVIFFAFLPPLAIYVLKRGESPYVRFHAAQALNLWITAVLYSLSFGIIGAILALDTVATGVVVGVTLITATGLVLLIHAVLAAVAANRGTLYRIAGWICVPMVK